MKKKTKDLLYRTWFWVRRIFIYLFLLQLFYIIILKWIDPPITITQLNSWVGGSGLKRDYVNSSDISSNIKLAVIASEDQLFPDHSGFDWKNIRKAMKYNKRKPNRIHGASTISQQVAKNVFLWQGRSWFRKGLESYFTKMIEWIWGKKRILEVYLNVIEMGDGVFGIEAASQHYFRKSASDLTRMQSALIASCLPNPKRFTIKPLSGFVAVKSRWVLQQMYELQSDPDIQKVIYLPGKK